MKTASMVLGIVGGALAIIIALWIVLGGIAVLNQGFLNQGTWNYGPRGMVENGLALAETFFIFYGALAALGGILGLVGGLIVKKSNVAAGVMMIIAAVVSLIVVVNIISMILFILGAVFAFMREKPAYPPYPPYPSPPQPPYHPQPPAPPQPPVPPQA